MLKMTANYKKKINCILIAHEMKQNVFPRIIQIQDIRIKEGWLFGFYVNIDVLSIHLLRNSSDFL